MSYTFTTRGLMLIWILSVQTACPAQSAPLRIMTLGDSITQGHVTTGTYRAWLWNNLARAGCLVDFVGTQTVMAGTASQPVSFDTDHEGHAGWKADQILAQIQGWASLNVPDVVLIHLGTNDLWAYESPASTIAELGQIILRLRRVNPDVTILLAQIIPSIWPHLQQQIGPFNAGLPLLAAQLTRTGSPVEVVDQCTGFDPWLDTTDGVHPTLQGHRKLADRWLEALGPHLGGLYLSINQDAGTGSLAIRNLGGPPDADYLTVFSFSAANQGSAFGTGPFGGLFISTSSVMTQLEVGLPPFYGLLDGDGASTFLMPAGSLSHLAGLTVFATTHIVEPVSRVFLGSSPPTVLILN